MRPSPRPGTLRALAAACAFVFVLLMGAVRARAADPLPRGPGFGNNRYRTALGRGDEDDYVASLVRGEVLTATVTARRGSGLHPTLVLLDPDGVPVTAPALRARAFAVDRTGRWTVRIRAGADESGEYDVRFAVRPPPATVLRGVHLGGTDPLELAHAFDAVAGARLDARLTLRRRSGPAQMTSIAAPDGEAAGALEVRRRGRVATGTCVLGGTADGACALTVALEEGEATYDLVLAVRPPERPRGLRVLSPDEPRLTPVGAPLRGAASQGLRLTGANLSAGARPDVWFGDRRAGVLAVAASGTWIDVAPPAHPDGTVVDVAVVNPDGQAVVVPRCFEYVPPVVPRLDTVAPGTASVYADATLRFRLTLTRAAPPAGLIVALSAPASLGALPSSAWFYGGAAETTFELRAAAAPSAGRIEARLGDVVVGADVTVVARPVGPEEPPPLPDEIDISGWALLQTNSARRFTFPSGTVLKQGDHVVVGRAASQLAFEAYWGVTLGSTVRYFTNDPENTSAAGDDWPSINGDETFELRDAADRRVDGPTIAMQTGGLANYQRVAGAPPGQGTSWATSALLQPGASPSPGRGPADTDEKHGVFVSEFSDVAPGAGQYAYEFVELHFDGLP